MGGLGGTFKEYAKMKGSRLRTQIYIYIDRNTYIYICNPKP